MAIRLTIIGKIMLIMYNIFDKKQVYFSCLKCLN